jgi:hypothetical protein
MGKWENEKEMRKKWGKNTKNETRGIEDTIGKIAFKTDMQVEIGFLIIK